MSQTRNLDTVSELASLAQDLEHQLPLLDAKRAGAELYGAPRLSLFDLIRPNENVFSRIIADLLDPLGAHGQGHLFLNALLGSLDMPRVGVRDVVRVACEVQTDALRRIDIVVETPTVLLGIENKPWAVQQPNQLSDYLRELENRAHGRRFVLVFLSDQDEKSAQGQVIRLPYYASQPQPSLHGLLSSVVGMVRAPRARAHVEDFMHHINLEFGGALVIEQGDEPYVEAVQAEFDRSPARKKALAVVMLAQSRLHARILEDIGTFLLRTVREKLSGDFVSGEIGLYDCLIEKNMYWSLSRPSWPRNCHVCLDSDRGWFDKVYVGIRAPDPNANGPEWACSARVQLEDVRKKIPGGGRTSGWPWWRYTTPSNWGPEFAAHLVIESPTADVEQHASVQELSRLVVQLAEAVEACL
jgi:hypothetical protein